MVAGILQYSGPQLDLAGNFLKGQQIAALREDRQMRQEDRAKADKAEAQSQGVLSNFDGDYEKAAAQLLSVDPKMANTVLSMGNLKQKQQLNAASIAQERIKQRQEKISYETKLAKGAFDALQGVKDPEQKKQIYDLYMQNLPEGTDVPQDLKSGWSEENEQSLGMISQLGQAMLDLDPSKMTAQQRNFQSYKKDPEFAAFYDRDNERDLSGTEKIVEELRAENPSLSYADALSLAQGLARKGLNIEDGNVKPIDGLTESTEQLSEAEQKGKEKVKLDFASKIEEAKITGKAQGEANVELANAKATLPKLVEITSELSDLAKNATYTEIGKAWAAARRQAGQEVTQSDIDRRKYIAVVDNEVLPLLRQTFGAAFTEREGQSLKATLGDPDATPEEKQAVLDAFLKKAEREIETKGRLYSELRGEEFKETSPEMTVEQKRARLMELRKKAGMQ